MKKIISVSLAAVMLSTLVACGGNTSTPSTNAPESQAVESKAEDAKTEDGEKTEEIGRAHV